MPSDFDLFRLLFSSSLQQDNEPGVENRTMTPPPMNSTSQNDETEDILTAEQMDISHHETASDVEYDGTDGRPPEQNDKLLKRLKRNHSAIKQIDSGEIPQKRSKVQTNTDTESISHHRKSHAQKKRSSPKTVKKVGGFFKKLKSNLREQGQKLKKKLSGRRMGKMQATSAGKFFVTNCRQRKVIENINGFLVVPDQQAFKSEPE